MNNYDDIINLPHYEPKFHKRMSIYNRSAQFAPFAALTGYEEQILEAARYTNEKIILSEEQIEIQNRKLQIIKDKISDRPKVIVTYFVKDMKKEGGRYDTIEKNVRRIDDVNMQLIMTDNFVIEIEDILNIDSDVIIDEYM